MAREYVSYTSKWFYDVADRFFRDLGRSIAFGVIMFFSLVFLLGPLLIYNSFDNIGNVDSFDTSSTDDTVAGIFILFIGLLLCIPCWWAALEVADDRHWEKPVPAIWDNHKARWIEHTVRCLRYLESQGRTTDTSLVLSDDIYAAAHKLIDETDEVTVRLLLSALMVNNTARILSPSRQLESYKEI
jgi:hypothetical protein